jgi:hypothetical protein
MLTNAFIFNADDRNVLGSVYKAAEHLQSTFYFGVVSSSHLRETFLLTSHVLPSLDLQSNTCADFCPLASPIATLHDQAHEFENIRASLAHELTCESEKRLLSDKRAHHLEEEVRVLRVLRDEMRQLKTQLQGATTVTTTNKIADVDVEDGPKGSNFTMDGSTLEDPSGMIMGGLEIADSPHKTPQVLPNTAPENSGDAVCSVSSAKGGDPSPVSSTPTTPPTKAESDDMRLKRSEWFQMPVASKLEYGNGSNPAVSPKVVVKCARVAVKHHVRTNSTMYYINETFRETETLREEAVAQEYDPQTSSARHDEPTPVHHVPDELADAFGGYGESSESSPSPVRCDPALVQRAKPDSSSKPHTSETMEQRRQDDANTSETQAHRRPPQRQEEVTAKCGEDEPTDVRKNRLTAPFFPSHRLVHPHFPHIDW